jgi:hypothetical protein
MSLECDTSAAFPLLLSLKFRCVNNLRQVVFDKCLPAFYSAGSKRHDGTSFMACYTVSLDYAVPGLHPEDDGTANFRNVAELLIYRHSVTSRKT